MPSCCQWTAGKHFISGPVNCFQRLWQCLLRPLMSEDWSNHGSSLLLFNPVCMLFAHMWNSFVISFLYSAHFWRIKGSLNHSSVLLSCSGGGHCLGLHRFNLIPQVCLLEKTGLLLSGIVCTELMYIPQIVALRASHESLWWIMCSLRWSLKLFVWILCP